MPETLTTTTRADVTPLAGHIGAEITGLDTGVPLSDNAVARIRRALLDHKVVFLRGQSLNYRRHIGVTVVMGWGFDDDQLLVPAYLAASSAAQGVPGSQIVAATRNYPFIPAGQQLYWLGSTPHDPTSPIVRAYQQTAQFLVSQGRLASVPSAAAIAAHIDTTFVKKALAGGCPS